MYQHLLVPIDNSELAITLVGQAVGLARRLDASLCFFHALPELDGRVAGDAEILRATAPEVHSQALGGYVRELLAKAEAAARALGVPCSCIAQRSDNVARAIIDLAAAQGCDLIVMASHARHGKLGMALGSETLEVLLRSGRPVLVAAVGELAPASRALAVIRDEHRTLAAVLHAWQDWLTRQPVAPFAASPQLLALDFIEIFSQQLHHPKESDHLFRLLRQRSSSLDAELNELDRQHERDAALLAELRAAVQAGDAGLASRLQAYAEFCWEHLGREEGVVLPAAQRLLHPADWEALEQVFTAAPGPDTRHMAQLAQRALTALAT